ncbi:hypothetical protein GOEFS_039_00120 [Gordonia effusa NBRC 100432]|uniref:AAA domain-containing protein n=1 Tax=Gordonia effusa NBRC 100432 TaxID=1077974 RepID=H0QY77_9ACTN|nr:hypothetical protein [Gordonia effusa]GAB17778.1 hypothetical protein GOEFS_039_00120 [Gordonia effusa NBRC 100432]
MPAPSITSWRPSPDTAVKRAARLERTIDLKRWRPHRIAVVPLEAAAPTSVVAALIAIAGNRTLEDRMIGIDTSGERSLTHLLGAGAGGNLGGLGQSDITRRERRAVDNYVDFETTTGVGVVAPTPTHPDIAPEILNDALLGIRRRFRGFVIDTPSSVAGSLMRPALGNSDRVVAVTSGSRIPDWVFNTANPLQRFLHTSRLTVVLPFQQGQPEAVTRYSTSIRTFPLGITVYPDGRWDLPLTGRGLDLSLGDIGLSDITVKLARHIFEAGDR